VEGGGNIEAVVVVGNYRLAGQFVSLNFGLWKLQNEQTMKAWINSIASEIGGMGGTRVRRK
jgi:hypothetical protein